MIEQLSLHHQGASERTIFGFWVYLMTDLIMFAALFATFAVLRNNTFGGPSGKELFSLPFVLVETLILLTSSFTCGLGLLAVHRFDKKQVITWFIITFLLGAGFILPDAISGQTKGRHFITIGQGAHFRIAGQIADEQYFV